MSHNAHRKLPVTSEGMQMKLSEVTAVH